MDDNWAADPTKPLTTERYKMRDGSYWKQELPTTFEQSHNILNFTWQACDQRWSHSVTAHYTYGYGYYTEFKKDTKLASKFGINEMYEKNGELKPVSRTLYARRDLRRTITALSTTSTTRTLCGRNGRLQHAALPLQPLGQGDVHR